MAALEPTPDAAEGWAKYAVIAIGDIHGIPRQHGFGYGVQLRSLFREESMERRLAVILATDRVG